MNISISPERLIYLRNKRKRLFLITITQILILVVFIVAWEISANIGILDSFITSQPSRILKTILNYNENYSIVSTYDTEELTSLGFTQEAISNYKKVKLYEENYVCMLWQHMSFATSRICF